MNPTLAVIVPAYCEEEGLPATLDSLLRQTVPPEQVIVIDDCSPDRTRAVAESYAARFGGRLTVVTPTPGTGSKAGAQNHGLNFVTCDLVLPVDADTVLADDYVELLKPVFDDDRVAVAAGCVLARNPRTLWERGRSIEYLAGFHWFRPVQNMANSPMVCSGCCSVFRTAELIAFGGFPTATITEDIHYTLAKQIEGRHARYVAAAVAYAAEPTSLKYMRAQLRRWKAGWFQNVRLHYRQLVRRKPVLALWVSLALFDICLSPLTIALPVVWLAVWHRTLGQAAGWWALSEALLMAPPLTYAMIRRRIAPWTIAASYPAFYVLKCLNFVYDMKALVTELILVPLGASTGLHHYEKGRADTPAAAAAPAAPAPKQVAGRGRHRKGDPIISLPPPRGPVPSWARSGPDDETVELPRPGTTRALPVVAVEVA